MDRSMTLRYTPVQKDYENVLRQFFWQRKGTKVSVAVMIIAFGLVLYLILTKDAQPTIFELMWLLMPPFFVAFVFLLQPKRIAKQAAQNEQLVTEATWELGDTGVRISSRFGSLLLEWQSLDKLVKTGDYYLLLSKANKNAFRFVPRRAFTSPEDESSFVKAVESYLSA